MWSTCGILLTTPLALFLSVCGLVVDRTKWLAGGGAVISGALILILVLKALGVSLLQ
jgi:hypothetical protein